MRPHPASIMSGTAAWRQWKVPVRLTAIMRSHASAVMSRKSAKPSIPALGHHDLDRPEGGPHRVEGGLDGGPVADVDHGGARRAAGGGDLLGHRLGRIAIDVEHRDLPTGVGQLVADGPAHAGPTAGDDCDAAHRRLLPMRASPSFSAPTSLNTCR